MKYLKQTRFNLFLLALLIILMIFIIMAKYLYAMTFKWIN